MEEGDGSKLTENQQHIYAAASALDACKLARKHVSCLPFKLWLCDICCRHCLGALHHNNRIISLAHSTAASLMGQEPLMFAADGWDNRPKADAGPPRQAQVHPELSRHKTPTAVVFSFLFRCRFCCSSGQTKHEVAARQPRQLLYPFECRCYSDC